MRLHEVKPNKSYLYESIFNSNDLNSLTVEQKRVIEQVEDTLLPHLNEFQSHVLTEADLTADQVQNLFTNITNDAGTATNPGFLKKGVKAIGQSLPVKALKAANDALNQLGGAIQDTKPVQQFDQLYRDARGKIVTSLGKTQGGEKIVKMVKDYGTWAKENPGKQAFVLGVLMVVGGIAAGPAGGMVAGYVMRAANEMAKGEDISTVVGKAAKTAVIGLAIGGITDAVGALADNLFPPEVSDLFIAADGASIDLGELEAMSATSLENLSPEEIKELFQARSAMLTMIKTGVENPEDMETLQTGFKAINQQIRDLGGADEMKDFAGLTGSDMDLARTTTDTTQATDQLSGVTGSTEDIVMDTVDTVSAAELDGAGINFMTEPGLTPEWTTEMEGWGLDPTEVKQIENAFKIEKAISDREWMGQSISAKNQIVDWSGEAPDIAITKLGIDPNKLVSGSSFTTEMSVSIEGIDAPINVVSRNMIEGVDAAGNPVFTMNEIHIMPDTKLPYDALDKLSEEQLDRFWDMESQFSGTMSSSEADVTEIVNNFKNTLANGIGAVATAAAVGGALAGAEVQGAKADKEKSEESFMPDLAEDFYNAELNEFDLSSLKALTKQTQLKLGKVGAMTSKKLNKAWEKAGEPLDIGSIGNILSSAGIEPEVVSTAFDEIGVEAPALDAPKAPADAETGAETDAEAPPGEEPATTSSIPADISMMELATMILDAGLIEIPSGKRLDPILAKLLPEEDTKENEMRVDEMCGEGCGAEMEMPKTNYNLSVTKDEGSTHKTMTVTSDQPDELIRVLQLSGMDTRHSEPDGDEIAGVDMDHDEPNSVSSMKDLISKVSHPPVGHDEAVEDVEPR
jgi:hypothetical protein